ncbi:MAG: SHOCT domain-containing protein [Phycisphaerales bacterium]|nr:SHOCT domain-containing protein [Phycisphaerales bacterium]
MLRLTVIAESDFSCFLILFAALAIAMIFIVVVQIGRHQLAQSAVAAVRSRKDFRATDIYVSPLDLNGLAIESASARLLLIQGKRHSILPASEIVTVEIMADDTSLVRTNRDSQVAGAAIGGLLLGPIGLLIGGVTGSKRSEARVKRLVLRIVTTNFANPHHDVLLYKSVSSKGDLKSSLKQSMRVAETWHSRVTVLIRGAATNVPPTRGTDGVSVADEVRKLDALRREGILTDREFINQKKRLLAGRDPTASQP